MEIGIYGGSFDPIHLGHTRIAEALCAEGLLEEVWFMISPCNPMKQGRRLLPERDRLELAELAVEGHKGLRVSDFEFNMPRPSYTIDTLRALETHYPNNHFSLVIGADNWEIFPRWKSAEELADRYRIVIFPRLGSDVDVKNLPPKAQLAHTPIVPISSTEIRALISAGGDASAMLDPAVWQRIKERGYYR
jgi:nicotinate-nucleotide adenylyltransferase